MVTHFYTAVTQPKTAIQELIISSNFKWPNGNLHDANVQSPLSEEMLETSFSQLIKWKITTNFQEMLIRELSTANRIFRKLRLTSYQ